MVTGESKFKILAGLFPLSRHFLPTFTTISLHNTQAKMLEILVQGVGQGPSGCPKDAIEAFATVVEDGGFSKVKKQLSTRVSRREALLKWQRLREANPTITEAEIRKMQRAEAAERKRQARKVYRGQGVSPKGVLVKGEKWREISMGDEISVWKKKLSFVPVMEIGSFGKENQAKLQSLQERLVKVVRLRGGATIESAPASNAAKRTKKHQKGVSMGLTVAPGGRRPQNPLTSTRHYSGTIQHKKFTDATMLELQNEAVQVLTDCIEEAFGPSLWYTAVKQAFRNIPENRRLPNTPLPASGIWWNWNVGKSEPHIDSNVMMPCFVFTPYTYHGAELLCSATNMKIPMEAGRIVGGSWARYPHCNDRLLSGERYSFVVYMDYRLLDDNYWVRY